MANLFDDMPAPGADEVFTDLLRLPGLRIERIVSTGQASPKGFWYDQATDEWVMVLAGRAGLAVAGEGERVLGPGDHVFLPAHCRHRVDWTDPDRPTVWLAVHIGAADG